MHTAHSDVLTGNSKINAHSGSIKITLQKNVNARFKIVTESGSVHAAGAIEEFENYQSYATGVKGNSTNVTIDAISHSGSIKLEAKS